MMLIQSIKNNVYVLLNLKKIQRENKNRKGQCSKCGWICCQKGCPFLLENGCKIYNLRPLTCRLAPIKEDYDREKWGEKGCTYWWENKI